MPTYEYVCKACGQEFEVFQSITEEPLKKCPECGGEARRRIGTGAGLIFKGSGFYITDYKNKANASKPAEKTTPKKDKSSKKSKE